MIMRVCRREVSCGRGWGVSLRSTTCKRMVTVPGGELRCTGNLCSKRERGRGGAPLSFESQRATADHKPPAKHRWAFFLGKNRTRTDDFSTHSWCDIFVTARDNSCHQFITWSQKVFVSHYSWLWFTYAVIWKMQMYDRFRNLVTWAQ